MFERMRGMRRVAGFLLLHVTFADPAAPRGHAWVDGLGYVEASHRQAGCWRGDAVLEKSCCAQHGLADLARGDADLRCWHDGLTYELCCPPQSAVMTCLQSATAIGAWGRVTAWYIWDVPQTSDSLWVEVLAIRPIIVGWRQGYMGRTFRIMGSSGPVLLGPDAWQRPTRVPQAGKLLVQPGDVVGWRYHRPGRATVAAGAAARDARGTWCIGPKGCDSEGLCKFDEPIDASIPNLALVPEIWPRKTPVAKPLAPLLPALDLSGKIDVNTTYDEFMTLRNKLRHPSLHLFEDKIRLRRELLPRVGVPATPSILLTNDDPEAVLPSIKDRSTYVVKPSHMSESQNVFVIHNGVDLLRKAWGQPDPVASPEQIQETVRGFMQKTALDWECGALVSVPPGVVVEELVLSYLDGGLKVDEYKFYTVWGEVVFGESVPFSSGAVSWISRFGEVWATKGTCPPYCVAPCYGQMVEMAERVAKGARTDFLRVDILIAGACERLYVSEVELFPASEFDPVLMAEVASRWRRGYGLPG